MVNIKTWAHMGKYYTTFGPFTTEAQAKDLVNGKITIQAKHPRKSYLEVKQSLQESFPVLMRRAELSRDHALIDDLFDFQYHIKTQTAKLEQLQRRAEPITEITSSVLDQLNARRNKKQTCLCGVPIKTHRKPTLILHLSNLTRLVSKNPVLLP